MNNQRLSARLRRVLCRKGLLHGYGLYRIQDMPFGTSGEPVQFAEAVGFFYARSSGNASAAIDIAGALTGGRRHSFGMTVFNEAGAAGDLVKVEDIFYRIADSRTVLPGCRVWELEAYGA